MLNNRNGATLVEIMIAMLIFGIGIIAAVRALPESSQKTTRSRNISKAVNLAQEKVEELMGVSWNHADLAAGAHVDPTNPIETHYIRSWSVQDNTPVESMKTISVSVTFPTSSADSVATLRTFRSQRQ